MILKQPKGYCAFMFMCWLIFVGSISIMISPWWLLVLLIGFKCKSEDSKEPESLDNESGGEKIDI